MRHFINVDTEENINKVFDIVTELYAREVSGNCVVRELQGEGWNDLCDMVIRLIAEIRPNFNFKVFEDIIGKSTDTPDIKESQEVENG